MKTRLTLFLAATFLSASVVFPQTLLTTTLVGANEPNGGDPNGRGSAVVVINGTTATFLLTESNLGASPSAAHIHRLATSQIVVPFTISFNNGVATGTANIPGATPDVAAALANEIATNPNAFYVNVHSSQFPGGAIRGTLMSSNATGVAGTENPSTCTASDTNLCLSSNRFRVEVTWKDPSGNTGPGHAVPLTSDTGSFWFFQSTNLEMTVKVLNACSFNPALWVFSSGLTNVQVTLKVTDTKTGNSRTYTNSLGSAFLPIQDTAAFQCP